MPIFVFLIFQILPTILSGKSYIIYFGHNLDNEKIQKIVSYYGSKSSFKWGSTPLMFFIFVYTSQLIFIWVFESLKKYFFRFYGHFYKTVFRKFRCFLKNDKNLIFPKLFKIFKFPLIKPSVSLIYRLCQNFIPIGKTYLA